MRNRLEIFALCAVLLLLPVFLEANAQAMEGSTPVYYNPDGGTYYHLDPDCASVAKEWRDRFDEFPYDSLFKSHWYLLPCSACVDIATQFLWEGEKGGPFPVMREGPPFLHFSNPVMGLIPYRTTQSRPGSAPAGRRSRRRGTRWWTEPRRSC